MHGQTNIVSHHLSDDSYHDIITTIAFVFWFM